MKKIIEKLSAGLALLLISAQPAFAATCTLNGKEIPCDQMPKWFWAIPIVMGVLGIFFFIFWLRMLLDAIRNQTENKTMWVLLIIFLNALGAIIYYFAEKRKRN
jgi:hypothetical protein